MLSTVPFFRWGNNVVVAALILGVAAQRSQAFEWQTETPEKHGFSSAKLDAFRAQLVKRATKALLIVHDDKIVYEWYSPQHAATKAHFTASMAKAIVGGVSTAVALSDGLLALDDPAAKFIPQWRDHPQKAKITIRQLGSHTSGIEDAEADNLAHDKLTGWKGDFWKRLPAPRDPFTLARDEAPVLWAPGTEMHYSNPGIALLTYATTAALKNSPQKDVRALLRERVMRPIGVPDAEWSVGYGQTVHVDGLPLVGSWGGGGYTARATARVARLMLREGDWEGRRILKAEAVRAITRDAGTPGNAAIGFWSNNEGTVAALPRDAYWGAGAQHQLVLVIPSLRVIAVRNGGSLGENHEGARDEFFFVPLMEALKGKN